MLASRRMLPVLASRMALDGTGPLLVVVPPAPHVVNDMIITSCRWRHIIVTKMPRDLHGRRQVQYQRLPRSGDKPRIAAHRDRRRERGDKAAGIRRCSALHRPGQRVVIGAGTGEELSGDNRVCNCHIAENADAHARFGSDNRVVSVGRCVDRSAIRGHSITPLRPRGFG